MDNRILEIILRARDEASKVIDKAAGNITSSFSKAQDASEKFALGLLGVSTAAAGVIGYGAKVAAELETSRQGFVTLLGSASKADAILEQIKKDAATTPFELPGLISANQALTLVTKNGEQSEGILLNLGKALAAAGKGQPELDRMIGNLQQIGLTGKITEMDIRQFGMNGVNVLELLADHYGVTTAEAGEMVKNSSNAFADLEAALAKAGGEGGRFARAYIDQAGTFNQSLSNAKDTLGIFLADLAKSSGAFDLMKDALKGFVDFMNDHGDEIISGVKTGLEWIKNNGAIVAGIILGALAPAIIGLAIAFGAATIALLPYIAAGAAIGLIAKFIIDNWGPISGFFVSLWTQVTTATQAGIDFLTVTVPAAIDTVIQWFAQLPDRAGSFVNKLFTEMIPYAIGFAIGWLMTAIPQLVNNVIMWFGALPTRVSEIFRQTRDSIVDRVLSAASWLFGEISSWPGRVQNFLASIPGILGQIFEDAKNAAIDKIVQLFHTLSDWWGKIKAIFDAIKGAAEAAIGAVQRGFDAGKQSGGRAFADGGWVRGTGQAVVHDGEFVLSRDMLAGRKPVPAEVPIGNQQRSVTINLGGVMVGSMGDVEALTHRLGFYYQTAGNL